jgi:hypothetical protein
MRRSPAASLSAPAAAESTSVPHPWGFWRRGACADTMNDQQSREREDPPEPREPRPPDSRRMALLGLLVALLLVVLGLIVVRVLGNAGRIQDCALSGRTNCAPLDSTQP